MTSNADRLFDASLTPSICDSDTDVCGMASACFHHNVDQRSASNTCLQGAAQPGGAVQKGKRVEKFDRGAVAATRASVDSLRLLPGLCYYY
jgi:hypothetical protein